MQFRVGRGESKQTTFTGPDIIRQVARGAGKLKKLLAKPPVKLDEEAEMQEKSGPKVPTKLHEERGNYETYVCQTADQVG